MKKYKIIPKRREDIFADLLKDMNLTGDERETVKRDFVIEHVEVTPKIRRWEIYIDTDKSLDSELLEKAENYLKKEHDLAAVVLKSAVTQETLRTLAHQT